MTEDYRKKKEENTQSLFLDYIKQIRVTLLSLLILLIVMLVMFWVYSINMQPLWYGIELSILIIGTFLLLDGIRYCRTQNTLRSIKKEETIMLAHLPVPNNSIEEAYQELLRLVDSRAKEMNQDWEEKYTNQIEYFTLWAHQIKTPLAAIKLLLQTSENEENQEIGIELFKVEEYVNMVLQYLRMEEMSSDLVLHWISLDQIVKSVIKKYAKIFIGKGLRVTLLVENVKVLSDEKWLQFVIEQIVANALKYTNEGTISIYMKSEQEKTLVIEDTGIGIRQEDIPRIFEKGFTGYNGRMENWSTGIGLYMCNKIVGKLSHQIKVESEVGVGTKVFLFLDSYSYEPED